MRIAGHCRGTPARHHVVVPGMPTSIETARLAGRPPRADDVPALLALYGSGEVAARMYPDGRPRTEAELGAGLEVDLAHWRAHAFGRYMWHERETGEVVAPCGPKLDLRGGGGARRSGGTGGTRAGPARSSPAAGRSSTCAVAGPSSTCTGPCAATATGAASPPRRRMWWCRPASTRSGPRASPRSSASTTPPRRRSPRRSASRSSATSSTSAGRTGSTAGAARPERLPRRVRVARRPAGVVLGTALARRVGRVGAARAALGALALAGARALALGVLLGHLVGHAGLTGILARRRLVGGLLVAHAERSTQRVAVQCAAGRWHTSVA